MLSTEQIGRLRTWVAEADKIAILAHANPDGDAIGSSLALGMALQQQVGEVNVIIPDGLPDFLRWLPGIQMSTTYIYKAEKAAAALEGCDLIFCLDFNDPGRLKGVAKLLEASDARRVMIDHHQDPKSFCELTISEPWRGSTGEMVYEFICEVFSGDVITRDIATCLYVAIMTDTGNFSYGSSYREVFTIVGQLMDYGIDKDQIYSRVYDAFSEDRMRLQGYCMQEKLVVLPQYHTAYISLSDEELRRFKHRKGDTEGFVNIPFAIKGIRFSALFIEKRDRVKASFRSRGRFPVNELAAAHYNGGGHINAAGGDSFESLEETVRRFESILPHYAKSLSEQ
ncbi:MAG: DHH family phosphoesterase [Bacteroidetes bacterium]|nr:MAG: DHH family phosphoesterase [Bacteroidota bacterium]